MGDLKTHFFAIYHTLAFGDTTPISNPYLYQLFFYILLNKEIIKIYSLEDTPLWFPE